jgi:hypothetical protein
MKLLPIILILFFTKSSFSQEEIIEKAPVEEDTQAVKPPVSQKKLVWTDVKEPIVIISGNAKDFMAHQSTPESVMNYFFASQIRRDKLWEKVVMREYWRGDLMQAQLDQYEKVEIIKFKLVSIAATVPNRRFWIKVDMEIKAAGKVKEITGDAEIIVLGGDWVILSLPTLDLASK